ncbi:MULTISPECIES: hypothetical protein [unclassified Paraburkholderia]|uniref:hypothetical protein n=1 Tax=unclassified Paraburkholderia TaxID=2615204 RepID=UPI00160C43AC|nr:MULTISPECIES: hypothetical protein [unclassified Paraburkholderia]MBB5444619.1 hypothetical protein [Paraburkholderia sp. WSM4177]MBB5485443.1 hypothetical protein [Paraburkholderia sp. WSM4180]
MLPLALRATVAAAAFASASCAFADDPFVVALLSTPQQMDVACRNLDQIGIHCVDGADGATRDKLGPGGLPLSKSEYSLFDQTDRPTVRGFLIRERLVDNAGNPYYRATATIYKTGFAGVGVTPTSLYNKPFWAFVSEEIPLAFPGSTEESDFLARMDAQIAAEKAAADRKATIAAEHEQQRMAAAAQAASEAAYRATPQYARDQARQAVANCRADIARARAAIAKDDRIAQISGYQNAILRRQAAAIIVNCEDTIARSGD